MALISAILVAIVGAIILGVGLVLNGAPLGLSDTQDPVAATVFWTGLIMLVVGAPLTYRFT